MTIEVSPDAPRTTPSTNRLFFAVFPDAQTAARMTALAQELRNEYELTGRAIATDRLHATLYFLGEYDAEPSGIVTAATAAASTVGMRAFDVAFDRVTSFSGRPGHLPLVLRGGDGVATLIDLQRALALAMQAAGLVAKTRMKFTPHVTLLYDGERVSESAIDAIRWNVQEFLLIYSQSDRPGYTTLGRWALTGPQPLVEDSRYMARALELARVAEDAGEVPVGAVIVSQGKIIGEGWNHPISANDPTAHAEIIAIRQAAQSLQSYRLTDATLYVTLEPCAMCAGAMVHSRLRRLVYAASDPRAGAAGSAFNLVQHDALNHRIEWTAGVLEAECSRQLRNFFQARR